jgi:colanic acid biosynthesis glycosyl transferase WcaI
MYLKPHTELKKIVSKSALSGTRITFVNRYFYPDISATSQMLFDLTRRLVKQGAIVSVVCSRQLYDDAQARLSKHEIVEGIHIHRVSTTRFGRGWLPGRVCDYLSFYMSAFIRLFQITQRGDVLVAKTDPPLISLAAAIVSRWRGAKLINWLQDLFPEVATHLGAGLPSWLQKSLVWLRDKSLHMASANVVIGTRMRAQLIDRGVSKDTLHVVENWADNGIDEPKPVEGSALRMSLGLRDKFVIGYSGNLGRAHEYETILAAAVALRLEPDVVFLMIGGGARMLQLKQAVAEHKLPNFIFQNYQPRELLPDSMAAADVHLTSLLPQLEGLIVPSKFYGIMAAGRPSIVIGDTDGELARIVRRVRCGESIAVGDWEGLVSAIWHMKLEPEYRHQMGARARRAYLEKHTADCGAENWLQILAAVESGLAMEQPYFPLVMESDQ